MIAVWKQGAVAIATEMASLSLLDGGNSSARLLSYFALHGLASVMVTVLAWLLLPAHLKTPRWAVLALLFSFDFFIPGLGVISMVVVLHVATRFPSAIRAERYAEIVEPVFLSSEKEKREQSDVRAGHARRILGDPKQSVDTKLRVLIALQGMRPKVAIPLLQGLLADPSEDIRLLAYSLMDAWEKDITTRIQTAQGQLEAAQKAGSETTSEEHKTQQINAHRRLAELYWEQVDSGLARGDLRTFSLGLAKSHCEAALPMDARVAGLWMLYSTILIELGEPAAAQRTLLLARKAGAPDTAVLPSLARLSFDDGDFVQAQTWMRRAGRAGHLTNTVRQCVRYWTGKSVDVQL
jgi:polysaccharide biosynthesis protein PelE